MNHQRSYFLRTKSPDYQSTGETNTLPSMTVPGQTLPLRTLVERYRRGADVAVFDGQYTEDESVTQVAKLDKVERADLALQVKDSIRSQRNQLAKLAQQEIKQQVSADPSSEDAITSLDV